MRATDVNLYRVPIIYGLILGAWVRCGGCGKLGSFLVWVVWIQIDFKASGWLYKRKFQNMAGHACFDLDRFLIESGAAGSMFIGKG